MIEEMTKCYQTETQNLYEHGLSVWKHTQKLLSKEHEGMKIPKWFENWDASLCHSLDTIEQYTIFHDIGKTRCLVIDEAGRRHFPDHATISRTMWLEKGCCPVVADLIGLDMIFHTETPEQIIARNLDEKTLRTLMMVALAELHANAEMFGGITSESFCIKYKRLSKRATRVLSALSSKTQHGNTSF